MGVPYEKQHSTYDEQVQDKLIGRGLRVDDRSKALSVLRSVGYYRLSGYLHTFKVKKAESATGHDERKDEFLPGASLSHVIDLWAFDRELRLVLLDGLERFEIELRTSLAYNTGKTDRYIHLRPDLLAPEFSKPKSDGGPSNYEEWRTKYDERVDQAQGESFVRWFAYKYDSRLPIWAAVEVFELGQLGRLYRGLQLEHKRQISGDFGYPTQKDFGSWIAALNGIRNVAAHHSRLWNRTLVSSASRPKAGQIERLDHLRALPDNTLRKIYAPIAFLTWVIGRNGEGDEWRGKMLATLATFPENEFTSLANAGFPEGWQCQGLWR
ncbi:MAG: hypothetical protein JWQ68_2301 [Cryobacterium sp.]|jgi:abortive infection bacteriophage resistance protein|nr:hypothetical protein [Cryobacterium sp.]